MSNATINRIIGMMLASVVLALPAHGEIILVTSSSDQPDTDVLDGVCETVTGTCSLRAAVEHANWTWGEDEIRFSHAWNHHLSSPLPVHSILTIRGEGADGSGTTITGDDSVEVFDVQTPHTEWNPVSLTIKHTRIEDGRRNITVSPDAELTIESCEIRGGYTGGLGGGIHSTDAPVTITDSWIVGNEALDGGGAIYFTSDDSHKDLYIARTTIMNNYSGGEAAGIYMVSNLSTLTLNDVRLEANQTLLGEGGAVYSILSKVWVRDSTFTQNVAQRGGAIYVLNGSLKIQESSIWGNMGAQAGGGLYLTTIQGATPEIINTTISGNLTSGHGGGIYLDTSGEFWKGVVISNSTITNNIADLNMDDVGDGGGIYREGYYDILVMNNSILAGNDDLSDSGYLPDCVGRINGTYNVIGVATPSCELVGTQTGVQTGTVASPLDPGIGPRIDDAYNAYHAVFESSPAVDMGNPAGCHEFDGTLILHDQRGGFRPHGRACDVGSIESAWALPAMLNIEVSGDGVGAVTSSPGGINCPGDCDEAYDLNTTVTLTADPDSSYYHWFEGWHGDADCADGVVTMSDDLECTAIFREYLLHSFVLNTSGTGSGTTTLDFDEVQFPCSGSCGTSLRDGEELTLIPEADPGSVFVGFGGHHDCVDGSLTIFSDVTCEAIYDLEGSGGDLIFMNGFEDGSTSDWSSTF